jgi:uncharacterized protein YfdQ (DUF2303 family)
LYDERNMPAENGVVADLAVAGVEPKKLDPNDGVVSVIVPAGAKHELVDLEKHRFSPWRQRGTVKVQTTDDLVRYVKRHDDPTSTTIWLDGDAHKVVAVLNDHRHVDEDGPGGAEWGDHRAELVLRKTPEWLHWEGLDNKLVEQDIFSEHIERGLAEIREPDSATMLELSQSIQGSVGASFKSTRRLQDGTVELQYVEDPNVQAGPGGDIPIPAKLVLYIAPFVGESPVLVEARFRYRVRQGKVWLGYSLDRPWEILREAIDRVGVELMTTFESEDEPSRVFLGSPRG